MIEAAIDIGTNTMLMLIAEIETSPKRRIGKILKDQLEVVRLGEGVHRNRAFAPAAMERSRQCFQRYKEICEQYKVDRVYGIATSASRDSANAKEFYASILKETGIPVRIIDGETEAKLSFIGGLLPHQDPKTSALLDIGGGSTEFVTAKNGKVHGQSVDLGSVRVTEMFLSGDPYDRKALEKMERHLKKSWAQIDKSVQEELREKSWVGIAGTATTLAALAQSLPKFDAAKVDGFVMDRCMVGDLYESLAIQTQAQRDASPVIGKGRADIIVAGAAILYTAMEFFDKEDVSVSSRGLRHGALVTEF